MSDPSAAGGLEQYFSYRLHVLGKLTDRELSDAFDRELGLSLQEARALVLVGYGRAASVSDIARNANFDKSQASRAVDGLVGKGLLRKEASAADGRGVVLSLTSAGEERWRAACAVAEASNSALLACLSEAERDELGRLLLRLLAHVRGEPQG